MLEKLQREFRLTYTLVKRREGGELEEFLKRLHIIEPNYESITVCPEPKHSNSLIERFSQLDGKLPKICQTPSTGALPLDSEPLDCDMASEYRSLVGMAMYLSQERYDLQYATKTLASSLKTPTKAAWLGLKRLVGYLRFSEGFSLKMRKTQKGDSFMEHLMNVHSDKLRNCVEVFSDSDWSGNFDMKSTSSAINTLNGIVIHSTSRTQKAISLSSTEAEWYAASSSVCDCMFLQHIVEFLTDDDCEIFTLHTDNSAVRMLALKFGVGRLKHIRGRMLWAQQKVSLRELQIRQVKTMFNIADLNTKPLSKDRFMSLLYMLGFVSDKSAVGENEFSRMQAKEVVRSQVKTITQVLHGHIDDEDSSMRVSSSNLSKQSKRVLRVLSLCSFFTLTESMSPPEALGHGYDGKNSDISVISWYVLLRGITTFACMLCGLFFLVRKCAKQRAVLQPEVQGDHIPSDNEVEVSSASSLPLTGWNAFQFAISDNEHSPESILIWTHTRCRGRILRCSDGDEIQEYQSLCEMFSSLVHSCDRMRHDARYASGLMYLLRSMDDLRPRDENYAICFTSQTSRSSLISEFITLIMTFLNLNLYLVARCFGT